MKFFLHAVHYKACTRSHILTPEDENNFDKFIFGCCEGASKPNLQSWTMKVRFLFHCIINQIDFSTLMIISDLILQQIFVLPSVIEENTEHSINFLSITIKITDTKIAKL